MKSFERSAARSVYENICKKQIAINEKILSTPFTKHSDVKTITTEEENGKKRKLAKIKTNLEKLPYYVVINEILVFHTLEITPRHGNQLRNQFMCFGYFSRDKFRNIWFLFKSIYVDDDFHFGGVGVREVTPFEFKFMFETYIDFNSLENLKIDIDNDSEKKEIIPFAAKFTKLNSLNISCNGNIDNFLSQIRCKRLDRLTLFVDLRSEDKFVIKNEIVNFPVKNLKITSFFSLTNFDNYFKLDYVKEIEKLNLSKVDFGNVREWVHMKNLKVLLLRKISQDILPFFRLDYPKLEGLSITQCLTLKKTSSLLNTHLNYSKLKHLFLWYHDDSMLCMGIFPGLEYLNFRCSGNNKVTFRWKKFEKLKVLRISCAMFDDQLFQENRFPVIEELVIILNGDIEDLPTTAAIHGKNWSKMPNIRRFRVNLGILDEIFQNQKFENLEEISCIFRVLPPDFTRVCGKNWKEMEKLKILNLGDFASEHFNSSFLVDAFSFLEHLTLHNAKKVEPGVNLSSLNYIELREVGITDHFFSIVVFPKLRKVKLNRIKKITGIRWKTPAVKKISVISCPKFSDSFFRGKSKLERVTLIDLSLTGIGWVSGVETSVINTLDVTSCPNFGDDFMKGENFSKFRNLSIVRFSKLNITGENWFIIPFIFDFLCKYVNMDTFCDTEFPNKKSFVLSVKNCVHFNEKQLYIRINEGKLGIFSGFSRGSIVHEDWRQIQLLKDICNIDKQMAKLLY